MPLFYQHNINDTAKFAVWHITEEENFFLQKIQLKKIINHPHKRLQHLAGRYLLQLLQPGFPLHLIEIADSNKPLLSNEAFHFSISHCRDFAAAIVSENKLVGIDVELIQPKIEFIKHKFLSDTEQKLLPASTPQLLTLMWSCKEAVYKWYGRRGIDFRSDIVIKNISLSEKEGLVECTFMKEKKDLEIYFHLFRNLCLAWVIG